MERIFLEKGKNISGKGKVFFGNNFHSGKKLRIINTFHNFKTSNKLPYDDIFYSKDVKIGDNVWIGENVLILGGVTIGEGAIIQARSVVSMNIPDLAIAGGNPAKAFKYRDENHYYKLKNNYQKGKYEKKSKFC